MPSMVIILSCAAAALLIYKMMRKLDGFISRSAVTENPRRRRGESFSESHSRVVYVDKKLNK